MNLSYWEYKTWFSDVDFAIIGSGIVGLNCALALKKRYPKSNVLILERGILPQGASSKNAGFACFGSLSEIISDLETHTEQETLQLIEKRIKGLELLRSILGDKALAYEPLGGHELFLQKDKDLFARCKSQFDAVNRLLYPIYNANVFSWQPNHFGFEGINQSLSFNAFEGQIDTGKMIEALILKAQKSGVKILNNCEVKSFNEANEKVEVITEEFSFSTKQLLIATNGFAAQLLPQSVKPARAQVLITKPIKNLTIKGTFHLDQGYYYFRNIDNRILFGGGRNLDFNAEETTTMGLTEIVQNKLEERLKTVILPNTNFEIEQRWSGIMGVGHQKKPIVKSIGERVHCGVRLGGMGVAIGSLVGKELAELVL